MDDSSQTYQEDTSKSKVDDGELDQMIASIKGGSAPVAAPVAPPAAPVVTPVLTTTTPTSAPAPAPTQPIAPPPVPAAPIAVPPELDNIKRGALAELRPLIDKLTLPPEEKFNTILLIIRSTDDVSLLTTAYEAARAIPDENRRAQALLDVIKEVDFFGQQAK